MYIWTTYSKYHILHNILGPQIFGSSPKKVSRSQTEISIGPQLPMPSMKQLHVDSNKLAHGSRMIYAGFTCFFGLGLEDGHVATVFRLDLQHDFLKDMR